MTLCFPADICSCPPFECSCNKTSTLSQNYGYVGRSPLAANTPHVENFTPGLDSYSPQVSSLDGYSSSSPWTGVMEWPNHNQEPWSGGWCNTQGVMLPNDAHGGYDTRPSDMSLHQLPISHAAMVDHQHLPPDASFSGEDAENLFALDTFQPSDIFAMEDPQAVTGGVVRDSSQFELLNEDSLSDSLNSLPLSTNASQATDGNANRFLQCLDDIIGDCLGSDAANELVHPVSDTTLNNLYPTNQFSGHQQWSNMGQSTMMTTITKTTKITASIEEKVMFNTPTLYQDSTPGSYSQYNTDIYPCQNPTTQIVNNNQKCPPQSPQTTQLASDYCPTEISCSCANYPYDCISHPQGKSPSIGNFPQQTIQNLDTNETISGSPILINDSGKYEHPSTIIDSNSRIEQDPNYYSIYPPIHNSPEHCQAHIPTSEYKLEDRRLPQYLPPTNVRQDYDLTLYTSSYCLGTDSEKLGENGSDNIACSLRQTVPTNCQVSLK